jgi:2'-5' RNA ligase
MIRSFIAIELGSRALGQVVAFQKVLIDTGADIKLVEAENIHITLRFLGEMPLNLTNKISEELKFLQFGPFEASIQGTGFFPDLRRINVVWVGIGKGILELINIHGQVESKLKKLGIRPDDRGFSPHITVARVRSARNKDRLAETILSTRDEEFGAFEVDSVKLKKSILTPKGPIYTTLAEASATENRSQK